MRIALLAIVLLSTAGCHYTTTTDVTHDPRFQFGYAAGQTWTLTTDAYLMSFPSDIPPRVLCTEAVYRRVFVNGDRASDHGEALLAVVPRGSTIRIERLQYSEDHDIDLWAHLQRMKELVAVGTVTKPNGRTWHDVIAPGTRKPYPVTTVDGVVIFRPNADMVARPDGASTRPAN